MADARTWLENRVKALRLEYATDGDTQAEIGRYMWNLAMEMGAQLRGVDHGMFTMVVDALVDEYTRPAPLTTPPPSSGVVTFLNADQLWAAETRFLRWGKGWKQTHLADLVGATNAQISDWETDKSIPSPEARARVDQALGRPPLQLPLKGCE